MLDSVIKDKVKYEIKDEANNEDVLDSVTKDEVKFNAQILFTNHAELIYEEGAEVLINQWELKLGFALQTDYPGRN
ncbi:hypothetical protein N7486_010849 [Penicillium sp. IBT 16267x]|nr:hypothetical protein N7486_010849 [Penicillium sp. IBT 16267x]